MNKAFVREDNDAEEEPPEPSTALPQGFKNYIRPAGHQAIKDELLQLIDHDRPEVVRLVSWAASNGDRSENGDYIYGKRRLREIDRRIHFLTRRMETSVIVDPAAQAQLDRVFFGATVTFLRNGQNTETITIVGVDEIDPPKNWVSWISPIAKALIKSAEGDEVLLRTPASKDVPAGTDTLEIVSISYPQ